MRKAIWILWPSFIVAGVAEVLFFTAFDPAVLEGVLGIESRLGWYTVGFLAFWVFAAASSAFTCFLQRTAGEINGCPLAPAERPVGCPKREDPSAAC